MSKGILEPSYRRRTAYQAMLLGGMATFASALLVLANQHTAEDIALRRAEDLKASLSQVVPAEVHDNDLLADVIELPADGNTPPLRIYRGTRATEVTAVAYEVVGQGYGGAITCLIGVDKEGRLLGVRVLAHAETPGLGDKIEARKDDWIETFTGRSLTDPSPSGWKVKKDGGVFDQFTGATITPRAVVKTVHQGLLYFRDHKQALLAPEAEAKGPDQKAPAEATLTKNTAHRREESP